MPVKQVENTLALLEFFAERQQPATLADVVQRMGWPRSSAFNILSTLLERGYLYEPHARGGFYPTPRLLQMALVIAEGEPLPAPLARAMHRVAEETGETALVSAPSGLYAVYLDVVESKAVVRYAARPGIRVPLHATASGQALLSQLSPQDLGVLLRKMTFKQFGMNTPMSIDEVLAKIDESRKRGWFQSGWTYSPDVGAAALPVVDGDRVFALAAAGPLIRVESKAEEHALLLYRVIDEEFGAGHSRRTLRDFNVLL